MRQCLDQQGTAGQSIKLATCDWGVEEPWTWAGNSSGPAATMWRTAPDLLDSYASLCDTVDQQLGLHLWAEEQGGINDPDGLWAGGEGMTSTEYRTQFLLWAILAAPLIASNDVTKIDNSTLALLSASEVLRVDQDPLAAGGTLLEWHASGMQVWARALQGNARAVLFWNRNGSAALPAPAVAWGSLGIPVSAACNVMDTLTGRPISQAGAQHVSYPQNISEHDAVLLRLQCSAAEGDAALQAMDAWRPALAPHLAQLGAAKREAAMGPWLQSQRTQDWWVGFFEGASAQLPAGAGLQGCMPALLGRGIELQRGWQAFEHSWDASDRKHGAEALLALLRDVAELVGDAGKQCRVPMLYGRLEVLASELMHPASGWRQLALQVLRHALSVVELGSKAVSQWKAGVFGSSGHATGELFMLLSVQLHPVPTPNASNASTTPASLRNIHAGAVY